MALIKKYLEKLPCFTFSGQRSVATGQILIYGEVWPGLYYVKWHNSMLGGIILWTKPGQGYILELTQFSY